MKVLTVITIVMSVPTMVFSFYGMNVLGGPGGAQPGDQRPLQEIGGDAGVLADGKPGLSAPLLPVSYTHLSYRPFRPPDVWEAAAAEEHPLLRLQ